MGEIFIWLVLSVFDVVCRLFWNVCFSDAENALTF